MNFTRLSTLGLFALLSVPLLSLTTGLRYDRPVNGVERVSGFPQFERESWYNEKFQRTAAKWAEQRNGFWGSLVATSNEINVRLFGQVSSGYNESVMLGTNGFFFQPMYLRAFNRTRKPPVRTHQTVIQRLIKLHGELKKRGIDLVVLISPNVIAVEPEIVPNRFVDPSRLSRQQSYDTFLPMLESSGVPYVDAFAILKERSSELQLFEPTASHWNHLGACLATRFVFGAAAAQRPTKYHAPDCSNVTFEPQPRGPERDLIDIANLAQPDRFFRPSPYVSASPPPPGTEKPKVTMIGTSFLFGVTDQLELHQLTRDYRLFFYWRQVRRLGNSKLFGFDKRNFDWRPLLESDLIVLEVNQSGPGQLGFGFIENLLRAIPKHGL